MGARVEVARLTKKYESSPGQIINALDHVSLSIEPSSVVALTGPSGSGKSTFLHMVGAMDEPDSGTVTSDEIEITALPRSKRTDYRRGIGFIFQRFHLIPALTALDNVVVPLLPYKRDFDRVGRARELLESVGLGERLSSPPSRLSGGEQQRVAIARALINLPSLLLADEPTGNLDSATGTDIMQLILDLRQERGMTVVVATHDPVIAARCDRIVKLQDGEIMDDLVVRQAASADEVLDRISRLEPGL